MLSFEQFLQKQFVSDWREHFQESLQKRCEPKRWGDLPKWEAALNALPDITASHIDLSKDAIQIGSPSDIDNAIKRQIIDALKQMNPWRKGPFDFFGVHLDCEWRSDWKWQRIEGHLSNLSGKKVLDVGCGTGYHGWRMLGAGANYVMGIDPSMRFVYQHAMAQKYILSNQFDFLPLGIEDMPTNMPVFDTVFSMGVLYHRKNPNNHLIELRNLLKTGGELVLETLIIDEDYQDINGGIFTPEERYAKMRNVWTIATIPHLIKCLKESGFSDIQCIDINVTSLKEQRATDWMTFHSLKDFLHPDNTSLTVEGYPAPKRATLIAKK